MPTLSKLLTITACCLLAGCASSPSSNSAAAKAAQVSPSKSYAMAPTPVFAGAATTVGGDNQTYYFDFDRSKILASDAESIKAQSDYLISHPGARVRLEGNTDNRGSREYNIALGWRRDQTVQHMMLQDGVSPKQIVMLSYGKERPAVLGDNEAAWAKNRRVNLIYEAK